VTADLAAAALFMKLSSTGQFLTIPDLSSPLVLNGTYANITITLSDSKDTQSFNLTVVVLS